MKWEPIETVPETSEHGTKVDLWYDDGTRVMNAFKTLGEFVHQTNVFGETLYTYLPNIKPTHWMKVEAPK